MKWDSAQVRTELACERGQRYFYWNWTTFDEIILYVHLYRMSVAATAASISKILPYVHFHIENVGSFHSVGKYGYTHTYNIYS